MSKFIYSRVHHKPDNQKHFWVVIFIATLILIISFLLYHSTIYLGENRVIREYAKAIKTDDVILMKSLIAVEYDAKDEPEKEISNMKGLSFIIFTDYDPSPLSGYRKVAKTFGLKGFKPFIRRVEMIGVGDAWYIVMGDLKEEYKR